MKKVTVIPNPTKDTGLYVTRRVVDKLLSLGLTVYIDSSVDFQSTDGVVFYTDPPTDTEMIIVIGGDGSVIDASVHALALDIPLIGVNLGRIGYLSEVEPDSLDIFDNLSDCRFSVEERMLLSAECILASGESISSERLAVNDVVVSQDGYFGIASFSVINSRGETVRYRGNGVIVATPVGSTAYSLSAGGPVIAHGLESITVTPVCPHSFFNRSIVYEPSECIRIVNTGDLSLNISIDGRSFTSLSSGGECRISASRQKLKMITFSESNMFSTLFKKIKLLQDNA